jgi:protocatechuate 3,4-dioxygenase beta subunit
MTLMNDGNSQHAFDDHDDFGGLSRDIPLLTRRRAIGIFGGFSVAAMLAACGSDESTSPVPPNTAAASEGTTVARPLVETTATTSEAAPVNPTTCAVIPDETGGPFPGDGTNGPNALTEAGIVRKDITNSIGSFSGVAKGVPLTMRFVLTDTANGCAPLANAAIYAWHCTRDGGYSMYSPGVEDENYLRGVQTADANGVVEFTTIFPGCYSGRWPHVHFEVYSTLDAAMAQSGFIKVSQLAFGRDICEQVYAADGYEASVGNLAGVSLESDGVFGDDGGVSQLGTVSGDVAGELSIELAVGVNSTVEPSMSGGGERGGPGPKPGGPPPT